MPETSSAAKDATKEGEKATAPAPVVPPTPVAEITANATLIERAVSTLEPRFTHRVLRSLTTLRKRTNAAVLREATSVLYPSGESVQKSYCVRK
jgi:26S proteasome regulatory subunit N3